jgi:hypothetical protein
LSGIPGTNICSNTVPTKEIAIIDIIIRTIPTINNVKIETVSYILRNMKAVYRIYEYYYTKYLV